MAARGGAARPASAPITWSASMSKQTALCSVRDGARRGPLQTRADITDHPHRSWMVVVVVVVLMVVVVVVARQQNPFGCI